MNGNWVDDEGPNTSELAADAKLVESLVGRTIVAATWVDENPNYEWTGHEAAFLTLDDGRVVRFAAWGYDAWGATVTVSAPGDAK